MTATEYDTQPSDMIVAGVDAHADTHHVVVLDRHGHRIADRQFTATFVGYRELLTWLSGLGHIVHIGVESTGTYAAALTQFLISHGVAVVEVNTPHAHTRARSGKDDRIDAEAAARKALSGESTAVPKDTSGPVKAIRTLSVTHDSAVKARSSALVQLRDLLITAPSELRESLTSKTRHGKASECIRLRPDRTRLHEPAQATKMALRTLSRRIVALDQEIADLDAALEQLVTAAAPVLTSHLGIGVGHAAQFLITAGQNVDRIHSEAAFARLCGAAPSLCRTEKHIECGCTAAVIAKPTALSTWSVSAACATTNERRTTSAAAPRRDCPRRTLCAASNATSPARSSMPSEPTS